MLRFAKFIGSNALLALRHSLPDHGISAYILDPLILQGFLTL
jgi:hypothetical protein